MLATFSPLNVSVPVSFTRSLAAVPVGMRKVKELQLGKDGARLVSCDAPLLPQAGDLRSVYGEAFSGEVCYEYVFLSEKACRVRLTLPELNDTAEVRINGEIAGYLTTSPYLLDFFALKGENHLSITVSNPAACAYTHFDASSCFTSAELGPYHDRTLAFEARNCRGGLQGPVVLRFLE